MGTVAVISEVNGSAAMSAPCNWAKGKKQMSCAKVHNGIVASKTKRKSPNVNASFARYPCGGRRQAAGYAVTRGRMPSRQALQQPLFVFMSRKPVYQPEYARP